MWRGMAESKGVEVGVVGKNVACLTSYRKPQFVSRHRPAIIVRAIWKKLQILEVLNYFGLLCNICQTNDINCT